MVILPEVREERVLALEVISWRIGVWAETTEVAGTSAWVVRDWAGVAGKIRKKYIAIKSDQSQIYEVFRRGWRHVWLTGYAFQIKIYLN